MKRSYVAIVFVLGCVSGGVASRVVDRPAQAAPAGVQKWEYDCGGTRGDLAKMNEAGAQGWELVTATPVGQTDQYLFCFKRPTA